MMNSRNGGRGFLSSFRRVSETATSLLKIRAELAVLEVKEEMARLLSATIWIGICLFSGLMAVITVSSTLLFYFWDQKLYVAIGILATSLVGATGALFIVKRRLKTPLLFAETIAQFKKDRAWIRR